MGQARPLNDGLVLGSSYISEAHGPTTKQIIHLKEKTSAQLWEGTLRKAEMERMLCQNKMVIIYI